MTEPLTVNLLQKIHPARAAIFLDFDGTLVEFAEHPELVRLAPEVRRDIGLIAELVHGALAIITGRDIGKIDEFLSPLVLPVAGVHGLTRRSADGAVHRFPIDQTAIEILMDRLQTFAGGTPQLLLERKQGSVALHYRKSPELEASCVKAVDGAVSDLAGIHVLRGKMVIEAKVDFGDKGSAVGDFMAEKPFAGRIPVFAGDDVTDEDAFRTVNESHGISIKVGRGTTSAHYRVESINAFHKWLHDLVTTLGKYDTQSKEPT